MLNQDPRKTRHTALKTHSKCSRISIYAPRFRQFLPCLASFFVSLANIDLCFLRWIIFASVIVLFDQWTKWLAITHLAYGEMIPVLPSVNLTLIYNQGAAFSFLSDAGGWQRGLLILVAATASVVLLLWLYRVAKSNKLLACALACILGGAMGNLWDRVIFGFVVDFIDLYYKTWHWPAFNIADSFIMLGAFLVIVDLLRKP